MKAGDEITFPSGRFPRAKIAAISSDTRLEIETSRRRFAVAFGVILTVAVASLAVVLIVAWHFISRVW